MTDIEERYEEICDRLDKKIDELILKCRALEEENRFLKELIEKYSKAYSDASWQIQNSRL